MFFGATGDFFRAAQWDFLARFLRKPGGVCGVANAHRGAAPMLALDASDGSTPMRAYLVMLASGRDAWIEFRVADCLLQPG
jgi:hypothetical protein